ncbi:MAG TPA: hypothetical protein ENN84_08345 [Candidatus Marinimicrobia bacterium]|nr:hypothetical protein [Candidatus Neomarinimicrobiota bacterium]
MEEIYKTQIYFVDPFYFLREMDNFEILLRKDGSIEFLYDGNKHIITQSNSFYRTVEEFTLSAIQAYFAINYPFQRIKGHIQLLSKHFRNMFETDTLPGAKAISISHLNRNGMATIANHALSVLLAFPAFLDFFNKENTSPTFSNPYYNSREILNTEFSRIIGTQSPSKKSVVYDNGHSKAVDEILEFQNQLAREISQLDHPISNRNLIQMKSESVERIQVADFVAGVARDVFKWRGKKILNSKFPRLIE